MATKTYNSKKVLVSFAGKILTGTMEGSFVTASRNNDSFTLAIGSDGEAARAANSDQSGTVTVTLMQTSPSNDDLANLMAQDELTNVGTGALFVKDASGRTLVSAVEAWIRKPADSEFAKEIGGREWTFETGRLDIFNGGN
jgi:Protein of unknown function (DUF3277)